MCVDWDDYERAERERKEDEKAARQRARQAAAGRKDVRPAHDFNKPLGRPQGYPGMKVAA